MAEFETIIIEGAPRLALSVAGAGELVVMLHGVGGNRRNWFSQIAALEPSFRAVAWDARGYGDSDNYVGAFGFGDVSNDLLRVLDHFGAERAHLIGLSMGGNIAMDFALRYPDRVASLVLADTDRGMRFLPADSREEFLRLRETPILAGVALDEMAGPILENLLGPDAKPEARREMSDSIRCLHRESYVKAIRATIEFDVTETLGAVTAPTLVIVGREDRLIPMRDAEAIARDIKGSTLIVIEKAGHLTNLEQAAIFNAAIRRFLFRHAQGGPPVP